MTMPSYTCRYMAAILLFGLSGFEAFGAQDSAYADRYADCISKHVTWSIEECDHIAKGETWMGMSDEQRAASEQALRPRLARSKKKVKAIATTTSRPMAAATPAAISTSGSEPSGLLWALILFGALLYLLPAFVASGRHHHQLAAIWILNIFLGWTLFGWVGALVWASTATHQEPT